MTAKDYYFDGYAHYSIHEVTKVILLPPSPHPRTKQFTNSDHVSIYSDKDLHTHYACTHAESKSFEIVKTLKEHSENSIASFCTKIANGTYSGRLHTLQFRMTVSGQRGLLSDCADAQTDMGLRCPFGVPGPISRTRQVPKSLYP